MVQQRELSRDHRLVLDLVPRLLDAVQQTPAESGCGAVLNDAGLRLLGLVIRQGLRKLEREDRAWPSLRRIEDMAPLQTMMLPQIPDETKPRRRGMKTVPVRRLRSRDLGVLARGMSIAAATRLLGSAYGSEIVQAARTVNLEDVAAIKHALLDGELDGAVHRATSSLRLLAASIGQVATGQQIAQDAPTKAASPDGPPLNIRQATGLLIVAELPGATGMTGSKIVDELERRGIDRGLGTDTFKRHDVKKLKEFGVESRPGGLGYFLSSDELKATARVVALNFGALRCPPDVT